MTQYFLSKRPSVSYYVDATGGEDVSDGLSPAQAWQTIARVNAATLNPGEQVLFKRGETFPGTLAPVSSGIAGRPIIYGAYGTGNNPIIDGSAELSALSIPLSATPASYLEFHDIFFSGGSSVVCKIYTHHVLMEDCEIANSATGFGLASSATTANYIHDNTFRRCSIHNNYKSGVVIGSDDPGYPYNMVVEDCLVYSNGTSTTADHGLYIDAGVIARRNTCNNNSSAGIKTNSEFGFNPLYYPVIYDNYCYGNYTGILSSHNSDVIYNNLVANNTYSGIHISYASNGIYVFNTIVNNQRYGAAFGTGTTGATFKNNLVIQDSSISGTYRPYLAQVPATIAANNTIDYNVCYYTGLSGSEFTAGDSSTTFAQWKALTGSPDANSVLLLALPGFVTRYTDLHPDDGGNLKAEGVAIAGYGTDKDGNARADPPTPGCYEEAAA